MVGDGSWERPEDDSGQVFLTVSSALESGVWRFEKETHGLEMTEMMGWAWAMVKGKVASSQLIGVGG